MKTKIFTRSCNYELYRMSGHCMLLDFPRVRLTNTRADGYFYRMLEDKDCDWAINIDEDAFVVDNKAILSLLNYAQRNGIVNCGVSDNQTARYYNPAVTNPFFNIINLKAVRERFSMDKIRNFRYAPHATEILGKVPSRFFNNDRTQINNDCEEPYYPFFLWMALHFPTLYLDSEFHRDGISTILRNHEGSPMLYHSWFSRYWRSDDFHTRRILSLYHEVTSRQNISPSIPGWWQKWSRWDCKFQIFARNIYTALDRFGIKNYVR